jgi:hypothetical protein
MCTISPVTNGDASRNKIPLTMSLTRGAVVGQLQEFLAADAGQAQHLDRGEFCSDRRAIR